MAIFFAFWLFTNYATKCQGQGRDKQGQGRDRAWTKRGQARTHRDKKGQTGQPISVPACSCLSLSVPVCPCLSLSVLVCPCFSLSVPICLNICYSCISPPADDYHSLHWYEHSNIDFGCKNHCSN